MRHNKRVKLGPDEKLLRISPEIMAQVPTWFPQRVGETIARLHEISENMAGVLGRMPHLAGDIEMVVALGSWLIMLDRGALEKLEERLRWVEELAKGGVVRK